MYNYVDKDQKHGNQTLQTQRDHLDYQGMSMRKRMTKKEVDAKMVCQLQPLDKKRAASRFVYLLFYYIVLVHEHLID